MMTKVNEASNENVAKRESLNGVEANGSEINSSGIKKPEVFPFYDGPTNTFSYIVKDPNSNVCAIIDSVLDFDYAVRFLYQNQVGAQSSKSDCTLVVCSTSKPDFEGSPHGSYTCTNS